MPSDSSTRRQFLLPLGGHSTTPDVVDESSDEGEVAAAESILRRFSTQAMGCHVELLLRNENDPAAAEAALAALEVIHQLEAVLSTYRPDSAISQVNRAPVGKWIKVPDTLFCVVQRSIELFQQSHGAFDITSGPLSKVWGFYLRRPRIPSTEEIAAALVMVGSQAIELDVAASAIRLNRAGCELNLASIGKGFALERAAEAMIGAATEDFLIHSGQSSIVARGNCHDNNGWSIGLGHPISPNRRLGVVTLVDGALATSGSHRQSLIHQGKRLGHVIDPRTGWPTFETLSVTVLSPSATEADALATAFCILSLEEIDEYCRTHPEVRAIVSRRDPNNAAEVVVHKMNLPSSTDAATADPAVRQSTFVQEVD